MTTVATSPATTVLVIEDDQEINELLGEYLTLEQIRYIQALTGKAGLARAAEVHPDAVILDLMLPDVDGFEIARQLSSHRATFDVPVLLLTCMNQDCDRHKGFSSGAMHFMNKPFLPDDLLGTIKAALEWRKSLQHRPPQGTVFISTARPLETIQQLNNMIADLFARTSLSDTAIAQIRDAFENLAAWALQWAETSGKDPQISIDYRILAGDALANGTPASAIEWTLSEAAPGLLAAAFFKATGPATAVTHPPGFSLAGTLNWALGRGKTAPNATPMPDAAGTAANWFQFLGKTGAAQFDRDSTRHVVRFIRELTAEHLVPVVSTDGTRAFPHRAHDEVAVTKKP
jgi:DNA-binding response OmpR family regulator